MELGYFSMPSHPPERGLKAGHDWDLQTLRWLDELGVFVKAYAGSSGAGAPRRMGEAFGGDVRSHFAPRGTPPHSVLAGRSRPGWARMKIARLSCAYRKGYS